MNADSQTATCAVLQHAKQGSQLTAKEYTRRAERQRRTDAHSTHLQDIMEGRKA